jgi:hypothetical protein
MGSNDLHRFWECEMDVGHAVNIQRIHLESCMRYSSCYDKTLANTSGLRSKNTDLASRYFFCGPERCRICMCMAYMYGFQNVQHSETRSVNSVHTCTHPDPECDGVCVCAHRVRSVHTRLAVPPKQGFSQKPQKPRFWGPDRVSKQ